MALFSSSQVTAGRKSGRFDGMADRLTRLAPSPTGALHLGNVRTFVLNCLLASQRSWRVLMRVEDLDGPRVKRGAAEQMLEELRWLGLQWSEPVVYQSRRHGVYAAALDRLAEAGAAYPCVCSRKDIETAASAPQGDEAPTVYPGTCRDRFPEVLAGRRSPPPEAAWRVRVDDAAITVDDRLAGRRTFNLSRTCGDFVVFNRRRQAAYQLAVVVDDAEAGVTAIVRGDDLLESAARQMHLRRGLGIEQDVEYWHLPLVLGADGRRLAKRHGDTRISFYRGGGATPQRILGLIGYWSGMLDRRREVDMEELQRRFDPARIPDGPVAFTKRDDDYLRGRKV